MNQILKIILVTTTFAITTLLISCGGGDGGSGTDNSSCTSKNSYSSQCSDAFSFSGGAETLCKSSTMAILYSSNVYSASGCSTLGAVGKCIYPNNSTYYYGGSASSMQTVCQNGGGTWTTATGSGGSGGSSGEIAAANACKTSSNVGLSGDPQVDGYCQIAQFDACLHRAGYTQYDAEGRTQCSILTNILQQLTGPNNGAWKCTAGCPNGVYPY